MAIGFVAIAVTCTRNTATRTTAGIVQPHPPRRAGHPEHRLHRRHRLRILWTIICTYAGCTTTTCTRSTSINFNSSSITHTRCINSSLRCSSSNNRHHNPRHIITGNLAQPQDRHRGCTEEKEEVHRRRTAILWVRRRFFDNRTVRNAPRRRRHHRRDILPGKARQPIHRTTTITTLLRRRRLRVGWKRRRSTGVCRPRPCCNIDRRRPGQCDSNSSSTTTTTSTSPCNTRSIHNTAVLPSTKRRNAPLTF